ncbi:MAG: hypothetical protein GY911_11820 [Actinomycetales bacterium]|nr:hypothetical protein [Actinomycetales bacterium]
MITLSIEGGKVVLVMEREGVRVTALLAGADALGLAMRLRLNALQVLGRRVELYVQDAETDDEATG